MEKLTGFMNKLKALPFVCGFIAIICLFLPGIIYQDYFVSNYIMIFGGKVNQYQFEFSFMIFLGYFLLIAASIISLFAYQYKKNCLWVISAILFIYSAILMIFQQSSLFNANLHLNEKEIFLAYGGITGIIISIIGGILTSYYVLINKYTNWLNLIILIPGFVIFTCFFLPALYSSGNGMNIVITNFGWITQNRLSNQKDAVPLVIQGYTLPVIASIAGFYGLHYKNKWVQMISGILFIDAIVMLCMLDSIYIKSQAYPPKNTHLGASCYIALIFAIIGLLFCGYLAYMQYKHNQKKSKKEM